MSEASEKFYVDVSGNALLAVEGADGLDLLQRISTNDLKHLAIGEHVGTVLTNEKGRIVDVLSIFRVAQDGLVISGASSGDDHLRSWIDRFIISEKVTLSILSQFRFQVLVLNTNTDELIFSIPSTKLLVAQLKYVDIPAVLVVGPKEFEEDVCSALAEKSIQRLSYNDYEVFRVRNGIPGYPRELSEQFNPLEVGLESLVSFSKGCYVGQEVIARLDTYQKVQRSLARLRLTSLPTTLPTVLITKDGREAGTLTSCVQGKEGFFGLGVLRKGLELTEISYLSSTSAPEGRASAITR